MALLGWIGALHWAAGEITSTSTGAATVPGKVDAVWLCAYPTLTV